MWLKLLSVSQKSSCEYRTKLNHAKQSATDPLKTASKKKQFKKKEKQLKIAVEIISTRAGSNPNTKSKTVEKSIEIQKQRYISPGKNIDELMLVSASQRAYLL